jgi:hypothetical protein
MTIRRDLKRRIRERQEKTGERYAAARAHVLAQRAQPPLFVELDDHSEAARERGLRLPVRAASSLRPAAERILDELRALATSGHPAVERLRRALLLGERPARGGGSARLLFLSWREFLHGVSLGFRGVGPGGLSLALDVDVAGTRRTVLAHVYARPMGEPLLLLTEWSREPNEPLGLISTWLGGGAP